MCVCVCVYFIMLGFKEAEKPEFKLPTSVGIMEKAREFQKNIYFCFTDYAKAFDCVGHNKLWEFLKRWEYQITLFISWETCTWIKKKQNKTWDNWLVQNWEKSRTRTKELLDDGETEDWKKLACNSTLKN